MSLREKLYVLSQGAEGQSAEELASEWTSAVADLFNNIRYFLGEYERDGLLSIAEEQITVDEGNIGTYLSSRLSIRSGHSLVRLTPIARLVAGALGRVDFANADMPQHGYMLLRQGLSPQDWQIANREVNFLVGKGGGSLVSGPIVFKEPLTKQSFELALENMLD